MDPMHLATVQAHLAKFPRKMDPCPICAGGEWHIDDLVSPPKTPAATSAQPHAAMLVPIICKGCFYVRFLAWPLVNGAMNMPVSNLS